MYDKAVENVFNYTQIGTYNYKKDNSMQVVFFGGS